MQLSTTTVISYDNYISPSPPLHQNVIVHANGAADDKVNDLQQKLFCFLLTSYDLGGYCT